MNEHKQIKKSRFGVTDAVDLSRPATTSQDRKNERVAQTARNKRVKVTLPSTPWDKESGNG